MLLYIASLIVQNLIQIKSGITTIANVGVKIYKNIVCAKTIMFGMLVHVLIKLIYI